MKKEPPAPSVFVRRKRRTETSKMPKEKKPTGIFDLDLSRPLPAELSQPTEPR